MRKALEAILFSAVLGTSAYSLAAKQYPITIIGNSHIVGLNLYVKKYGISTNLLLEDSYPETAQNNPNCLPLCDIVSYVGRNVESMCADLPSIILEMNKKGSNLAIVFEGPNSAIMSRDEIKSYLACVVKGLHEAGKKAYMAEMPLGVIGSRPLLTKEKVEEYNELIREVAADGIVETKNAPWIAKFLHGYVKGMTFPYLIRRFEEIRKQRQ